MPIVAYQQIYLFLEESSPVKSPPPKKQRVKPIGTDEEFEVELNNLLSESESEEEEVEEKEPLKEELDKYLQLQVSWPVKKANEEKTPRPDRSNWWKQNHKDFPILSKLARRFLAIPASSVPAERVFSVGGTLVSKKRSRLTPGHVEMLLFLNKNWK